MIIHTNHESYWNHNISQKESQPGRRVAQLIEQASHVQRPFRLGSSLILFPIISQAVQ